AAWAAGASRRRAEGGAAGGAGARALCLRDLGRRILVVLVQPILNLARRDAQDAGGARGGTAGVLERAQNRVALDVCQRCARDQRAVRAALALVGDAERTQIGGLDAAISAYHHRALDRMFELAHVAGPAVAIEPRQRGL